MVFAAGMISDAWVRRVRMRHAHSSMDSGRPTFGAERDRYFAQELGLDSLQRKRVDSVFARRRVQIDSFWKGPGRSLRAIIDSTRQEVRSVLTPEQRERFERRRMEGRPRHPGDAGPPMSSPPQ
jgi:Spy/CpxP family protein refolding chaperone